MKSASLPDVGNGTRSSGEQGGSLGAFVSLQSSCSLGIVWNIFTLCNISARRIRQALSLYLCDYIVAYSTHKAVIFLVVLLLSQHKINQSIKLFFVTCQEQPAHESL